MLYKIMSFNTLSFHSKKNIFFDIRSHIWKRLKVFISNIFMCLTPRRPIGKVTPTCPICRARQFRWRRCLRVSKISPTFSQVLKTLIWFLNSKFISEIAGNWLISSEILSQENMFYGAWETMSVRSYHPRMTHRWRSHLFNTISYK